MHGFLMVAHWIATIHLHVQRQMGCNIRGDGCAPFWAIAQPSPRPPPKRTLPESPPITNMGKKKPANRHLISQFELTFHRG